MIGCNNQQHDVDQGDSSQAKQVAKQEIDSSEIKAYEKPAANGSALIASEPSQSNRTNFFNSTKPQTLSSSVTDNRHFESRFDLFDSEDQEKIQLLIDIRNASLPEDKIKAIQEIDDYDGSRIVPFIRQALDDNDSQVRVAAIKKLSKMEELHAAVDGILYALNDPDPTVVMEAIRAIEETSDASLIPNLVPLKNHSNLEVQTKAEEVIEYLE